MLPRESHTAGTQPCEDGDLTGLLLLEGTPQAGCGGRGGGRERQAALWGGQSGDLRPWADQDKVGELWHH